MLLCVLGGLIAGIPIVPAAYQQYYLPALVIVCLFAAHGLDLLLDRSGQRTRAWLLVAAAVPLFVSPVVELAQALGRRNDLQMARLQFVFRQTRPTDPVLDGWLGTNVFRPHPLYYFFMHGELRAMLTTRQQDAYLNALTSGEVRPALITLDDELRALGPRFLDFVQRRYVSADGLFYLPRQSAPAAGEPARGLL